MRPHILAAVAGLSLVFVAPAYAAKNRSSAFTIEPMLDGKNFMGCSGTNLAVGMVFVAVEGGFSVMLIAPEFKVTKGDKVVGTWSVDDAKPRALSADANGAGIVSIDLDPSRENLALFNDGDELVARVGKASHAFSLADSEQGLADLTACMKAAGK